MIQILFYLPLIIIRGIWSILPKNAYTRLWFKYTYHPSSNQDRQRSQKIRNTIRLAKYKTKLFLRGKN